jgi:hypothetical protein
MEVTTDWNATHCGRGLDEGVKADSGSQYNLTLVVRSTIARCECARQVSFGKPCAFWDTPHARTAAAVLTGEFSECLVINGLLSIGETA